MLKRPSQMPSPDFSDSIANKIQPSKQRSMPKPLTY